MQDLRAKNNILKSVYVDYLLKTKLMLPTLQHKKIKNKWGESNPRHSTKETSTDPLRLIADNVKK